MTLTTDPPSCEDCGAIKTYTCPNCQGISAMDRAYEEQWGTDRERESPVLDETFLCLPTWLAGELWAVIERNEGRPGNVLAVSDTLEEAMSHADIDATNPNIVVTKVPGHTRVRCTGCGARMDFSGDVYVHPSCSRREGERDVGE